MQRILRLRIVIHVYEQELIQLHQCRYRRKQYFVARNLQQQHGHAKMLICCTSYYQTRAYARTHTHVRSHIHTHTHTHTHKIALTDTMIVKQHIIRYYSVYSAYKPTRFFISKYIHIFHNNVIPLSAQCIHTRLQCTVQFIDGTHVMVYIYLHLNLVNNRHIPLLRPLIVFIRTSPGCC